MNAAIAQHLNVAESAIIRVEEWANVLFAVVKGIGARFVSKKVVNVEMLDLQGSSKQVEWASSLRDQAIAWLKRQKPTPGNIMFGDGYTDEVKALKMARAAQRVQASWWIDRRAEIKNGLVWDHV